MLKIKPIPVGKANHPRSPHEALPRHEFTMGLIAPKGAGKTTVICNLLKFYKGYFHTILVFSPTILSDEKWDWVKEQKLLAQNLPLQKWIKEVSESQTEDCLVSNGLGSVLQGLVTRGDEFTGKIPEEHFFHDYDESRFVNLMEEQKKTINLLKSHRKPKYLANRILIIFDDLVGSALFAGNRGSYFKGVNTRHRHYSASFIMVSQGYKEVPKTIRTNWTCLILFEIGNEREVFVVYEEFAMGLKHDQWLELYNHAIEEEHGFLFVDFQKKRNRRIMKNFEEYLFLQKE